MNITPNARNKLSRGVKPSWMNSVGPYVGIIVNHLDPEYMGRVEVEILKIAESGNTGKNSGYVIPCEYVSPFYGVTPRKGAGYNNEYSNTQQSYGFWAVPPDIGVKVLVLMAENNYSYGYWIGCIQDRYMNFMIPGNASTTYNDMGDFAPTAEYNKALENFHAGTDPTKFIKPVNYDAYDKLVAQGIDKDQIRGQVTTSARREIPSMVFGWSTPGPSDKLGPKVEYGEDFGKTQVPFSRLGGSTFIMDDGDATLLRKGKPGPEPGQDYGGNKPEYVNAEAGETGGDVKLLFNELTRWKTRTGHQILMHNTEDLIYIINGNGSTWIELTSNGKIDIYAKDSISIHTEQDLNVTADRDFNFHALNNFHLKAEKDIFIEAVENMHVKVGKELKALSVEAMHLKTEANMHLETKLNWNVKAGLDGRITAGGQTGISSVHHKVQAGRIDHNGATPPAADAALKAEEAYVPIRIPEHEPWYSHENLNPQEFLPEKTDAIKNKDKKQTEIKGTPVVPDTFRKSL